MSAGVVTLVTMAIATYKDLCIDSSDSETLGRFYAAAMGLTFEPDGGAGSSWVSRNPRRSG